MIVIRRICYLGSVRNPHVRKFANYFCERNWDVHLITWRRPSDQSSLNPTITLHYINVPPHNILKLGSLIEISKIINRINPHILHAHYISTFGVISACYKMYHNNIPLVLSAQGSDVLLSGYCPLFRFMGQKLQKIAVTEADIIHIEGDYMASVLKHLGASDQKLKDIWYGIDVDIFKPTFNKNGDTFKHLNYDQSPIIISTRNLMQIYDVESLIKAASIVLKTVPTAKFVLIGKGPEENNLNRLVHELDLVDSVEFLGYISNIDLPKYLASSDIYVSTSLSDGGLATSTAEAMASGLPVIITDFGDNRKWVKDGINGYLIPLKNPMLLAEKIVFLIKDPDNRTLFGQRNREMVIDKLNLHKGMSKMEAVYVELITSKWKSDKI